MKYVPGYKFKIARALRTGGSLLQNRALNRLQVKDDVFNMNEEYQLTNIKKVEDNFVYSFNNLSTKQSFDLSFKSTQDAELRIDKVSKV